MATARKSACVGRGICAFDVEPIVLSLLPCFHDLAECTYSDVGMSVHRSDPMTLVVRNLEGCVGHSEWTE
jgi:hypothetical protein